MPQQVSFGRRYGVPIVALLILAVLVWVVARSKSGDQASRLPPPPTRHHWILVAADEHGALIADLTHVVGVDRDGRAIWRVSASANKLPAGFACADTCPNAVLSGSNASYGQAQLADPDLIWFTGSQRQETAPGIVAGQPGKTTVFAALSHSIQVAQRSDLGHRNEVVLDDPRGSISLPIPPTTMATAYSNPDLTHALLIMPTSKPSVQTAMWFIRNQGGWAKQGQFTAPSLYSGCLSDDGSQAVVIGNTARLVTTSRSGPSSITYPMRHVSNCAWSSQGPALVSNSVSSSGQRSVVAQYTADGVKVWSTTTSDADEISASTRQPEVAVASTGINSRVTVFSAEGHVNSNQQVDSAVITGSDLVSVDQSGDVTWSPLLAR